MSRSAVAKWENGLGLPSESSLVELIRYFGVSKDYFDVTNEYTIITRKNKKIRNYSISVKVIIIFTIVLLSSYLLYHPVPFYVSAKCNTAEVNLTNNATNSFQITEADSINELIDILNSAKFRKAFRNTNEAPNNLIAVFQIYDSNGVGCDVWLCSSYNGEYSVYIWTGYDELIACKPNYLGENLVNFIEKMTE